MYLFAVDLQSPAAFTDFRGLDATTCRICEEIIAPITRNPARIPAFPEVAPGVLGVNLTLVHRSIINCAFGLGRIELAE